MANGDVTDEAFESTFAEHLRHQTHVFVNQKFLAVRGGDTGRFLAAVLKRIKTEEG